MFDVRSVRNMKISFLPTRLPLLHFTLGTILHSIQPTEPFSTFNNWISLLNKYLNEFFALTPRLLSAFACREGYPVARYFFREFRSEFIILGKISVVIEDEKEGNEELLLLKVRKYFIPHKYEDGRWKWNWIFRKSPPSSIMRNFVIKMEIWENEKILSHLDEIL